MTAFFYDLFYMLPLAVAIILSLIGVGLHDSVFASQAEGYAMTGLTGCIVSGLFTVFALALRHSGKKERILIGGVPFVAFVSLFWLLGKEKRTILYERYSWILAILVITVIAIVLGKMAEKILWMKLVNSAVILATLVYILLNHLVCPSMAVGACFLVMTVYLAEFVQRYWKKSGYTDVKSHIALTAPMLLLLCILVSVIPAPSEKFDWQFAKNIWHAASEQYKRIVSMLSSEEEAYGFAGFTEDGSIEGGVANNDAEVLRITFEDNSLSELYLDGIILDTFDGKSWKTERNLTSRDRELDYLEIRAAVSKQFYGYERDYVRNVNLELENKLGNTRNLFLPAKANLMGAGMLPQYEETESAVRASSKLLFGDRYKISYLKTNASYPYFVLLMDTAEPITETEWDSLLRQNGWLRERGLSYADYQKYRDAIYEKYGGNRETTIEESLENADLSEEVKALLWEILESAQTLAIPDDPEDEADDAAYAKSLISTGDFEKLSAISSYLQTMHYSTAAAALPEESVDAKSYLDYFLLESRSGYCIHYATAFTLLARELGFPARYVQGYYVAKAEGSDVLVTENRAHAWAEVYFDNFGWVVFEATPGFQVYEGWVIKGGIGKMQLNPDYVALPTQVPETGESIFFETEEEKAKFPYLYLLIPLLCAVFFGALFLLTARKVEEMRYRKLDNTGKFKVTISKNMRILRLMGYPLGDFCTLTEYREGFSESEIRNLRFLTLYERMLYSDEDVEDADLKCAEEEYRTLKGLLRKKGFRYRFYIV